MHFKDQVIWITGASSGIGAALADMLAREKALLILTARNGQALAALQQELSSHTRCAVLEADLSCKEALPELVNRAIQSFGHIDIVIHGAGVSQRSLAIDTPIAIYRQLMEINFFAPIAITQYLLPHFRERAGGHVVAIGSMAGLMGFPMRTGYAAAKHALKGYFETLQVEHTIPGFHITIVNPGRINTPISLSALTASGTPHNEMDEGQLNGIPVKECATTILKAIISRKKHIMIARGERLLYGIKLVFPALYYRIARKKGLPV